MLTFQPGAAKWPIIWRESSAYHYGSQRRYDEGSRSANLQGTMFYAGPSLERCLASASNGRRWLPTPAFSSWLRGCAGSMGHRPNDVRNALPSRHSSFDWPPWRYASPPASTTIFQSAGPKGVSVEILN